MIWTLIALALVAGVLYAQRADSNDSAVGWSLAGGISSGPVKISGYARGLYPGVSGYLLTKVRNGSAHAVAITRIWVRAGRGAPGCPSKTLRIGRYRGRRLVGSGRTWRLAIPIMIRAGSADACQGARYPLLFLFRQARR